MKSIFKGLFTIIAVVGFVGLLLFSMKKGYFGEIDTTIKTVDPYTRGGFEIDGDGYLVEYWGTENEVVIPPTVKTISAKVFQGNNELISVTIPETVKVIEPNAFANCKNLQTVVLNAKIETLQYKTFYNCKSLTTVTLADHIKKIGYSAFEKCTNLTTINLPKKLEFMGGRTFKYCNLNTIEIPKSLEKVGRKKDDGPFSDSGLKIVTFEDGIKKIVANLFVGSNLTNVEIPSSVKIIERNAFSYSKELTNVTIEEGLKEIEKYAFRDCTALETMNLPKSLKTYSKTMLKNCKKVKLTVVENSKGHRYVERNNLDYELKK